MFARRDRDRQFVLADEVVGQPDIVESIDLDHDVVEAAALRTDAEGDGVVAIVAVHEDGRDDIFAHAELVFDATAHPEGGVEALRSRRIILADDAVAEAARGGFEATVHRAAGMKRFAELDLGAVEDFDRVPARVGELHHFEDAPLSGFLLGSDAELDAGGFELTLHLSELGGAGDAETEVFEIIGAVVVEHESMVPVVHAQVAAVAFTVVGQLHPENSRGEAFPFVEPLYADTHVAQLGYLDHFVLRSYAVAPQTDSAHWRNRSLTERSPSSENAIAETGYFGIMARTSIDQGRNHARRAKRAGLSGGLLRWRVWEGAGLNSLAKNCR